MMQLKKIILIATIFSTIVLQTGCWDQKIFEKIGFLLQLGVELNKDGKFIYTASIPMISPEATKRTEVISTETNLMREGRDKIRGVAGKNVEGGKVQQIFFSEEAAKKGIAEFLEIFLRNSENPLLSNVIVTEGSPRELMKLSADYSDKPRSTFYVNDLLESARRSSFVPETRISDIEILTHSGTIDPVTPRISYDNKEIKVEGAALFDGDKMVGKINIRDTGLLLGLMEEKKDIEYIYKGIYSKNEKIDVKNGMAITMRNQKKLININIEANKPVIDIKFDFKGSLNEYSGKLNLMNAEDKKRLESSVAESLKKDYMELFKYLVEVESDPIGFGEIIRTKHNPYWKSIKWKDAYKTAIFHVDVKVMFEFYGAVSNP